MPAGINTAELAPVINPTERKLILGNLIAAPFTGNLATGVGGALGGVLMAGMHQSKNPEIARAVQGLFGPHPMHAGMYGSILGYLAAKTATKKGHRND